MTAVGGAEKRAFSRRAAGRPVQRGGGGGSVTLLLVARGRRRAAAARRGEEDHIFISPVGGRPEGQARVSTMATPAAITPAVLAKVGIPAPRLSLRRPRARAPATRTARTARIATTHAAHFVGGDRRPLLHH